MSTILIAAVAGAAAVALLRGLFPLSKEYHFSSNDLPALAARYRKYTWGSVALYFLLSAVTGATWWLILFGLGSWRFTVLPDAVVALTPPPWAWAAPAFFLGLLSAVPLVTRLMRYMLKAQYTEFEAYRMALAGYDSRPLERIVMPVMVVLSIVAVLFLLDYYTLATTDSLIVNRLAGVGTDEYPYSEVRAVRRAHGLVRADGQVRWRDSPIYVFVFHSGERWSTRWQPAEIPPARLDSLATFVADQAGLAIRDIPFFSDADL